MKSEKNRRGRLFPKQAHLSTHKSYVTKQMNSHVLERRIRRMVKILVSEKRGEEQNLPFGLKLVFQKFQAPWLRILCSVVMIVSSVLLVYQIYDRFMYFLSQPIEVDVNIERYQTVSFPKIIISSPHTKEIVELMKATGIFSDDTMTCGRVLLLELMKKGGFNMKDLWDAAKTSDIIAQHVIINGEKVTTLPIGSSYTPISIGVTFNRSEKLVFQGENTAINVKIERPNGSCEFAPLIFVYSDIDDLIEYPNVLMALSGFDSTIAFKRKEYHFENRRSFPCTEISNYVNCEKGCRLKLYNSFDCKFPFMPVNVDLPYCNSSEDSIASFYNSKTVFTGADGRMQDCQCIRPCYQSYFEPSIVPIPQPRPEFDFIIQFTSSDVTVTTERRIYYFSLFMADVGGNLGLCLGICLLDFIYWFHIILTKNKNQKNITFKDNDPIFKIVCRVFRKTQGTLHCIGIKKLNCGWLATFHNVVVLLCTMLTSYLVFRRIEFFLQYPTTNVLEVKDNLTVQYPIVTVCMESKFVVTRKKWLARKKKLPSPCHPTILDFMDAPLFINAHKIWENSLSSDILNVDATIAESQRTVVAVLPFGKCTTYITDPVSHADTFGDFALPRLNPPGNCYAKIILTSPDDVIDSILYDAVPEHSFSLVFISMKVFEHNVVQGTNITAKAAASCKEECIFKKMMRKLKCTMPYITAINLTLPTCNSSREAKSTQDIYFEAFGAKQDCGCPRPQRELIYSSTAVPYIRDSGPTVIVFVLLNARIETLFQVFSYSLEKLISAVGSCISSILGLSLLSIMEIIYALNQKFKKP